MGRFNWCGTKSPKKEQPAEIGNEIRDELELLCSRVLGIYLNAELLKDRSEKPLDELLQDAVDRALIVACELDKKHRFGLF
jgi:hypothetical protein